MKTDYEKFQKHVYGLAYSCCEDTNISKRVTNLIVRKLRGKSRNDIFMNDIMSILQIDNRYFTSSGIKANTMTKQRRVLIEMQHKLNGGD